MITRADILHIAYRETLTVYPNISRRGTRWQHQARCLGVALDCVGLIGCVAVAAGVPGASAWLADETLKHYGRPPDPAMLLRAARHYMDEIPVASAGLADVLVLAHVSAPGHPTHFAFISQNKPRRIIHAETYARRVLEQGFSTTGKWVPTNVFRLRGVV